MSLALAAAASQASASTYTPLGAVESSATNVYAGCPPDGAGINFPNSEVEPWLDVNPTDAGIRASLALYLAKAGDSEPAEAEIARALERAPADVQVLIRSAIVRALAGKTDAALDAIERAVGLGYSRSLVVETEEFVTLRQQPRFRQLGLAPSREGTLP